MTLTEISAGDYDIKVGRREERLGGDGGKDESLAPTGRMCVCVCVVVCAYVREGRCVL